MSTRFSKAAGAWARSQSLGDTRRIVTIVTNKEGMCSLAGQAPQMTSSSDYTSVLGLYPGDCQPTSVEYLGNAGGFSGAEFWKIQTARGSACLRRWPKEHPTPERLEFIQAVLWHVDQEGFQLVPVPLETRQNAGYVRHDGYLWELTPWMPGVANFHADPSPAKLSAAMAALARFHRAAASFPLAEEGIARSPGMIERCGRLEELLQGRLQALRRSIPKTGWGTVGECATRIVELCTLVGPQFIPQLRAATRLEVPLQPCIRDIWHDHVLFQGSAVSGLVDFGAMRAENVAADVARLLGSLVGDDVQSWQAGLDAYQSVRPLGSGELTLVTAFDRATVLMGGLQWIEWLFLEQRGFSDHAAIARRLQCAHARLNHLASLLI